MAALSLTIFSSKPTSDGKFPIFICIYSKGNREYIKTEYKLDDTSQWYSNKVVARNDATMMNKRLQYELKKYKERLQDIENNDCYTAKQLKTVLTQQEKIIPSIRTFNEFMKTRITEIREEGRESYAKMQEDTLRVFEAAEGDVLMIIMNHITIEHFDRWMKLHGHTDGGRQIRLCHIKARVNEAIKLGLIRCDKHPFTYTPIPTPEPRELDISVEAVRKIISTDVSRSKRLALAKDMFLLSFYFGGINYADLIQIDFSGDEVVYTRQKSCKHKKKNRQIRFSICPEARIILTRYIGEDGIIKFDYDYSQKNMQCYINSCLKLLAKELNIKGRGLTYYSARKTFAQFAAEIGIPYPIIEYCLGHSIKTGITINSYVRVKPYQADAAIRRVIDYVNDPEIFKPYIEMRAQMQMFMGM